MAVFRALDTLLTATTLPLHAGGPSTLDVVGYTFGGVILSYVVYQVMLRFE